MSLNDTTQIVVADSGSSPTASTILMLPGWKGSDVGLRSVAVALVRDGFRVVTMNFPGAGVSKASPQCDQSLFGLAHLVEELASALELNSDTLLLGHSFGATIAAAVAARGRMAISGLILASPIVIGARDRRRRSRLKTKAPSAAVLKILERLPPRLVERTINSILVQSISNVSLARRGLFGVARTYRLSNSERRFVADPKSMSGALMTAACHGCLEWAPNISAPTWIVAGDRDAMSTVDELMMLRDQLRWGRLGVLEGSGHLAHHEDAKSFQQLVLKAVKENAARKSTEDG